jgi:putative transposase
MAQPRITLESGNTYHIWTHANGNENLFRCDENFRYFLRRYQHYVHPVAETFAYCLMPNHLHLMIRVRKEDEILEFVRVKKDDINITLQGLKDLGGLGKVISRQFSNLFNSYTQAYNKMFDRKGSLFIPNFRRMLIDSGEYFVRLIAYIHNNPVHHGFVKTPNNWPFSSWHSYLLDKTTNISKQEALKWFGTKKNFSAIHNQLNQEKMKKLFED